MYSETLGSPKLFYMLGTGPSVLVGGVYVVPFDSQNSPNDSGIIIPKPEALEG